MSLQMIAIACKILAAEHGLPNRFACSEVAEIAGTTARHVGMYCSSLYRHERNDVFKRNQLVFQGVEKSGGRSYLLVAALHGEISE